MQSRQSRQRRQIGRLQKDRQLRYTATILSAGAILSCSVVIWYFISRVSFSDVSTSEKKPSVLLYIAQVMSGNWSPDYFNPIDQTTGTIFIFGTIIAILLNFGTIIAVFGTATNIFIVQRLREMSTIAAFELRETAIIDELISELTDEQLEVIYPIIENSVRKGKERWAKELLPGVFGEAAAKKFLKALESKRPHQFRNNERASSYPRQDMK